jgi:hypothetical protein
MIEAEARMYHTTSPAQWPPRNFAAAIRPFAAPMESTASTPGPGVTA